MLFSPAELGFPADYRPPVGPMPPGQGRDAVPQFLSFATLVQTAMRGYRYTFDEALKQSPQNARAMRRDPVIWSSLRARQMPTAQLSWHIEPDDDTNPAEVEAAQLVEAIITRVPNFQNLRMQCLEALWFGRAGSELAYQWRPWRNNQQLFVRKFTPVNGDKLRFKWNGDVGILVHATFPGTKEATDWGMAHFLTPDEREQFIVHHHEPEDVDWLDGVQAGAVKGLGFRDRLYWYWWLKMQVIGLMMNYVERFSNGLTIYYYDASNPKAEGQAIAAASQQFKNFSLVYPRWAAGKDTNGVERLEVGTASPAFLMQLLSDYFDANIRQVILGQTLTSGTAPTGLGSGVAEAHENTFAGYVKYDAINLDATLQTDLVEVLYRYNAENITPGRFVSEIDTPNAQEVIANAQVMFGMGMSLDEDQLYELSQLQKPKPGGGVVSKLGMMQPAAVGAQPPAGMPSSGPAGPEQQSPQALPAASPASLGMPPQQFRRNGKLPRRFYRAEYAGKS